MGHGKGLNNEGKSVIIEESAKSTSLHVITEKLTVVTWTKLGDS